MRTLSKSIHISVSCNITVYKRGHCKGTYGTCGPQSRARCAASGPWLTNGVEECVVLLAKGKKKKKAPKEKSLSAWRSSSSTEGDTWRSGLCSYQSSSNTSSSLNPSAFVPPRCQGKKYIQDLLGALTCTRGLSKDRFGSSVICAAPL